MKNLKTGTIAAIMLAVIVFAACKKNSVSPSATTGPQLSFQMMADNNASLAAASNNALQTNALSTGIPGLTITAAVANISKFKLEAKKNGVETEIITKNLSNVNLFALSPSIANVTILPGTYTEVELRVDLDRSNTDSLPLKLNGTFTNSGGKVIPFEFDLNNNVEIKAEAENIVITDTTNFAAIVHMHLPKLEAGITAADLDAATLTNGILVISNSSNTSLYRRILDNFGACGESEFRHDHGDKNGGDNDNSGHGNNGND